jgi:dienelactone hydrolase
MASPYWANSAFFSLPWFYRQGYDVVLLTLPFHGARTARGSFSGGGLFAGGIAHLIEAVRQAIHDIRSLMRHLEAQGAPAIGMTGLSLGGFTTALMAEAEPKLAFAIPNCPPVDLGATGEQWFPASLLLKLGSRLRGVDRDRYMAAVRSVSPLTYPAAIPKDRLFVIAGLGDRLVMPEDPEALWEHWDRPKIHWFPGNHTLHVNRAAYLRRMKEFLATKGFVPEANAA